jgi:hypothetical protein
MSGAPTSASISGVPVEPGLPKLWVIPSLAQNAPAPDCHEREDGVVGSHFLKVKELHCTFLHRVNALEHNIKTISVRLVWIILSKLLLMLEDLAPITYGLGEHFRLINRKKSN